MFKIVSIFIVERKLYNIQFVSQSASRNQSQNVFLSDKKLQHNLAQN
jgi:hypothetical protein